MPRLLRFLRTLMSDFRVFRAAGWEPLVRNIMTSPIALDSQLHARRALAAKVVPGG